LSPAGAQVGSPAIEREFRPLSGVAERTQRQ
jgi:hypothetical protein